MKIVAYVLALAVPSAAWSAEPLVKPEWLSSQLTNENVVVLDIRNELDGGGREAYLEGHIPNAVHSDYLKDGWRTTRNGVAGVLPEPAVLEALLSDLGIGNDNHVVISHGGVDATDFGSAARIYWTLKYLGHDEVSILDGGWRGWVEDPSRPVARGGVDRPGELYWAEPRPELLASTADIKMSFANPDVIRVDARPLDQFLGRTKHKAAKWAGRLPDAVHFDQSSLIGADGRVKDIEEIGEFFAANIDLDAGKELYTYCNTGHWAATNWFVMSELLGVENVRLYDESMVGWTADPANRPNTGS